ncbi:MULTISPECIES: DUF1206 domain-containing protein [Nocardia]|uniref:Domain of Uncharacterized Function (DUF1206) n=2 Tax=Nocardia TaxID=1817 RepID=A0A0H5P2F9_NOCFR|nr:MULTISPECIES: DUF1206 domain-containing protein [Nocardia]AXK85290.1 DUF1206 domain-containing protein [Nocardia farcinica]MBA4857574.1 DUF1206 domain-containing protein [Nocardia farcinica]MBC9817937.1 DUF1206 domain-containing protein [Nocardia farcinica]MBF6067996.1 DUF1206 domain-containing protein [Nocardia farcinica]MBF6140132.1 DUF1206 domain-containing protein [Nocardia farcinica]
MVFGNTSAASSTDRIAQHPTFERFARAGFVMTGIVHLIVAYLALRVAFGGGGTADQSGAMAQIAAAPGGRVVLWIAVAAFLLMALWRLAEAVFGSASKPDHDNRRKEAMRRGKALAVAVVYAALALTAFTFARGGGKSSSGESQSLTARLLANTAGKAVLIAAGLVVLGVGAYYVYKGVTGKFLKDLDTAGPAIRRLGTAGHIAKGLAIGAIGALLILAVAQSDPSRSAGLDGALKTLLAQPYGVVLLVLAAIGIATYGLFSFVQARHAKM